MSTKPEKIVEHTPFPAQQYWLDDRGQLWTGPYTRNRMSPFNRYAFARFDGFIERCVELWVYDDRPMTLNPVNDIRWVHALMDQINEQILWPAA